MHPLHPLFTPEVLTNNIATLTELGDRFGEILNRNGVARGVGVRRTGWGGGR